MARTRNIKPGFFKSEQLADCDPLARILFAGLWTQADREGILEDRPRRIKTECLPYDDCDIDDLLSQLITREFITRYEVNGCKYIYIPTFKAHQNPHKDEKAKGFPPAPCKPGAGTMHAQCEHGSSRALNLKPEPDLLKPETNHLIPETATAAAQPSGACADEKAGTKNGKRPSVFDSVTVATLKNPSLLDAWWRMAYSQANPVVSGSDADRLRVHGAAVRAIDPKTKAKNATAVFVSIVSDRKWGNITAEQEDRAHDRIKSLDREARGDPVHA